MVSGSKNDSRVKKRQKMVLAKDPKQAALAAIVMALFFGNGIYMIVKHFQEQAKLAATAAQPASADAAQQAVDATQQVAGSTGFPLPVIILIVLVLAGLAGFAIMKYASKNGSAGPKKKQKMVLAKDPKQAALAVIVMALFFGNGIYMTVKHFQEQNAVSTASQGVTDPMMPEAQTPESVTDPQMAQDANNIYAQTMGEQGKDPNTLPPNVRSSQSSDDDVDIMSKRAATKRTGKMVLISVGDTGRSNPFLPAGENVLPSSSGSLPKFNLIAPPETLPVNSDASKVMTTTISGILYDKYSPSAIINIEGTDYLVKKGDVVNHYRILAIDKTLVLVQLGKNIYQAGVGQLLSQSNINYNTIANLNKKFGGNEVSIKVKKKKH